MWTGYEHGCHVLTRTDCIAATSVEQHNDAITYDFPMFSQPTTPGNVIGGLGD
jgi:hypothetical protein